VRLLRLLTSLAKIGKRALRWRFSSVPCWLGNRFRATADSSREIAEANPRQPAARCGLETAMLDALCRAMGVPLWALWGGAFSSPLETDITLPILEIGRCMELANHWFNNGFRTFKLKSGLQSGTGYRENPPDKQTLFRKYHLSLTQTRGLPRTRL